LKNAQIFIGFLAFCHVTGMVFSPFLQSFTLLMLGAVALFYFFFKTKDQKEVWKSYVGKSGLWIFGFIFLEVAIGVFTATDWHDMLERIRLRIPFIGLPFAFFLLPGLTPSFYRNWWLVILIFLNLVAFGVTIHYIFNQEEIQLLLKQGKAMPTPANHIRYALLQVIAFIASVYWGWVHSEQISSKFILRFYRFSAFMLFLFIHFLAVRSGLFSLYFILISFGIPYLIKKSAYISLLIFLAGVIFIPFIGIKLIPSLKQKMGYVYYDIDMFFKGKATDHLSDASRLISWKLGLELFKENPVFGVGAGNIKLRMNELYQKDYPAFKKKLTPHNQFIMVLASSGIIGLILFCIGFFIPLMYEKNYQDAFTLAVYLSFFASFWVEATFENAMGVAIFLFFILLHIKYKNNE